MKLEEAVLIVFSITGLMLLSLFHPLNKYDEKEIREIKSQCDGLVKTKADLIKTFVSKKGSIIGIFSSGEESIMAVLDNFYYPQKNMTVYAKASEYSGQCWLFVKKINSEEQ